MSEQRDIVERRPSYADGRGLQVRLYADHDALRGDLQADRLFAGAASAGHWIRDEDDTDDVSAIAQRICGNSKALNHRDLTGTTSCGRTHQVRQLGNT